MRAGIVVNITREDRRQLEAIVSDCSAPQKHLWRANIILATADCCGTAEIMRRQPDSGARPHPAVLADETRSVAGTMTHDYKRNGTTTLFAALNILDGTVIGRKMQRHRYQEFIRFLNVARSASSKAQDNPRHRRTYATYKHPKVRKWLARYPRWTFHFTPTSASRLNAVESFAKLTSRRLRRGIFRSVADLEAAINGFVVETTPTPNPSYGRQTPSASTQLSNEGKKS